MIAGKARCYTYANNKREARRGMSRNTEVREWEHCMGDQHGRIPGTEVRPTPKAEFIDVVGGMQRPLCAVCHEWLSSSPEQKIERLLDMISELRSSVEALENADYD